jgi:hypothetical protein
MGEKEISMGKEGSFYKKKLGQQGSAKSWNMKTTIVGMYGSLLELQMHEEVGC